MKKTVLMAIFSCFLMSCSKEKLIDESPSLVGVWKHFYSEDAWDVVTINSDGTGMVHYFTNGKSKEETKVKDWYIKDNRLYLGKVTFSLQPYTISEYPKTASSNFIAEADTVSVGDRYLEFNQLTFVEKN